MPEAADPTSLRVLERTSKAATAASVFLILIVQFAFHPDLTLLLRGVSVGAFVLGWFAGRSPGARIHTFWVIAAPLAPAVLRGLTGREGPVLEIMWMAGLAGSLLRTTSWSRWSLPPTWRVLLGGWALALALAWPVLVAREIGFDPRGLRDFGAVNSWAMLSAPHVVAWTLYVVLTQLLGLMWLDWLVGRFRERPDQVPQVAHGLWIGATIASLVSIYQGTIDLAFLSTPAWASLGRATGTMLDANAYGVVAALAGPPAFILLRSRRTPWADGAGIVVLVVNLLGMWMSGSRTALICGLCGVAALAVSTFAGPGLLRRRASHEDPSYASRNASKVLAAAITATLIIIVLASAVGPWRRLTDVPLTAEGLSLAWTRGPYGAIAMRMIREHPLTGVGAGAYHVLAPDYWRVEANNLLPFDNAQNWWRHQAAELGLLGGLPILGWSVLFAALVIRGRARSDFSTGIIVRGLLLGVGLSSLLGMPTQNPVVLLWFLFLAAWLTELADGRGAGWAASRTWTGILSIVMLLTAVGYASGHAVLGRGSLAVVERAKQSHRDFVSGAHAPESMPNGGEFRWTGRESRFVWEAKTRWLVLRVWASHPDIAARPVHLTLSTPCQIVFDEDLRSADSVSIGLQLPEGLRALETVVRVSRTWKPSAFGADDTRELGAGLAAQFQDSRQNTLEQHRVVELDNCTK